MLWILGAKTKISNDLLKSKITIYGIYDSCGDFYDSTAQCCTLRREFSFEYRIF